VVALSRQPPIISGHVALESIVGAALRTSIFFATVALRNDVNTVAASISITADELTKAIHVEQTRRGSSGADAIAMLEKSRDHGPKDEPATWAM